MLFHSFKITYLILHHLECSEDSYLLEVAYREALDENPYAQYILGHMNKIGLGVEVNQQNAITCFQQSAQKGNAVALRHLRICYVEGKGVLVEPEKAVVYFEQAAALGDVESLVLIAICKMRRGERVELPREELRNLEDRKRLVYECLFSQETNLKVSPDSLEQLKELAIHDIELMMNLSIIYHNGLGEHAQGSDETYQEELKWLELAASKGNTDAKVLLFKRYAVGKGVKKDKRKAEQLLREASLHGDAQEPYCAFWSPSGSEIPEFLREVLAPLVGPVVDFTSLASDEEDE